MLCLFPEEHLSDTQFLAISSISLVNVPKDSIIRVPGIRPPLGFVFMGGILRTDCSLRQCLILKLSRHGYHVCVGVCVKVCVINVKT